MLRTDDNPNKAVNECSTVETIYRELKNKLHDVIPDFELRDKAVLAHEIHMMKRQRDAVILAHNYMEPALYHSVPDFAGDSFELSRKAAETDASVIVFCGVRFMAETAKILNPDKTVLLPSAAGGCSLASSITADDVRELKRRFPGVPVVAYINTYAEVKAEVDVCCTSGNAVAVVESFKSDRVLFVPDEYLARNVARATGKQIIVPTRSASGELVVAELERGLVGWPGLCEVHEKFSVEDIESARRQFPDVVVLAHPECSPEVVDAADFSGSTSAMIKYVRNSDGGRHLLLTECSMGDNIAASNPDKEMLRLCSVRCPHMNEITLGETLASLKLNRYEIHVPEEIRARAVRSIERMLEIAP